MKEGGEEEKSKRTGGMNEEREKEDGRDSSSPEGRH